jgi:4-hydroxybenzoate polyprenyltransferase
MRVLSAVVRSMRPRQWTKNLLVFAALMFSNNITNGALVVRTLAAFAVFCVVSGGIYIFNDLIDIERDRVHAKKCLRPLAAGELSPTAAIVAIVGIVVLAAAGSSLLGVGFSLVVVAYVAVQFAYTLGLKHVALLDVMVISAGFVLRAIAGTIVISTPLSPWLLVCTALLALFLALGKRRHELLLLEDRAESHRAALDGYSPQLIDQLMATATSLTIMSYALYTFFPNVDPHHDRLMLTIPFVVYGLFRYLNLVYRHHLGGEPEEILLKDKPLIIDIALFVVAAGLALYIP